MSLRQTGVIALLMLVLSAGWTLFYTSQLRPTGLDLVQYFECLQVNLTPLDRFWLRFPLVSVLAGSILVICLKERLKLSDRVKAFVNMMYALIVILLPFQVLFTVLIFLFVLHIPFGKAG